MFKSRNRHLPTQCQNAQAIWQRENQDCKDAHNHAPAPAARLVFPLPCPHYRHPARREMRLVLDSCFRGRPEKAERHRQPRTRAMRGRKQKPRDECKVIDEKTEFGPIIAPMRRTMKRQSEEEDVSRRE